LGSFLNFQKKRKQLPNVGEKSPNLVTLATNKKESSVQRKGTPTDGGKIRRKNRNKKNEMDNFFDGEN
jgi:hypothetical protein